jgi:hypothetical protein
MAKKLETPYPMHKRGIPWEFKYRFVRGQQITLLKGFMRAIRTKFDAATAFEIYKMVGTTDERNKKMTTTLRDVFKIKGNDIEAMMTWWEIFYELLGIEATWLEVTNKIARYKVTVCPWSTPDPEDISGGYCFIFEDFVNKIINPKATTERPKGMCAGDPYCEYIYKIEE